MFSTLKRLLIGKPLRTEQLKEEKLPIWKALPILSSDALSSLSYGTEQILLVLSMVGAASLWYSLPITAAIIGLLTLLIFSYRQIIFQYPGGGGAYIVSSDNLGWFTGLIAGASLLIDYTLTVAVSVSAGAAAISSAIPAFHKHVTLIAVFFVIIVMALNLRGMRESGTIFAFPTYLFIIGIVGLVITGLFSVATHVTDRQIVQIPTYLPTGLTWFLLLRAFSSGCSALTGVEAISNATPSFQQPETKKASRTLLILGLLLGCMFAGTSLLAYLYHIVPRDTETVLSQISAHTFGRTFPYFYIQGTTALILILAANTSFSGFPLLASIMARDKFMPRMFAVRGDRLNFSNGIILVAIAAIVLILIFKGNVERLIPLYAIGVFLSFTLAQSGMVRRWWVHREHSWLPKLALNALGAAVSFSVLLIFAITKFSEGAWIVVLVIPCFIFLFYKIRRHYESIANELRIDCNNERPEPKDHVIVLPIGGINQVVKNTVSYAQSLDGDIVAFYVGFDKETIKKVETKWEMWNPDIRLVTTLSRYRSISQPLTRFIHLVETHAKGRHITVLIPEFITRKWWHRFLHNQTAILIRFLLRGRKNIVVATVPYLLRK
ncbi:amino acid/polyamine/organocation transporter, APC superfamily [Marininema mesophilum]|uniref:Amino acid/polyamine/organocation transporter, APC superfamily n=1 Tax=Marininema mesophilum TaxID=1048340 RepID=A0A1H2PZ26_9BACL|nr:APC family permease [Marininema mesophilum]SDW00071.1 amino acid/polyamine/organocation transporter, APC superfamily [Marininema mesophilum]